MHRKFVTLFRHKILIRERERGEHAEFYSELYLRLIIYVK